MNINNIKVSNINSPRSGSPVANQYEIRTNEGQYFQSYDSVIAFRSNDSIPTITLDGNYWDYSVTTLKYLKEFLRTGQSKKEIEKDIEAGVYKLANLNWLDLDGAY